MTSSSKKAVDTPFLLVLCALVVAGLLIFTSAALSLLVGDGGVTFTSVAVSQLLLGLVCGSIALVFFARVDYRVWRPYTAGPKLSIRDRAFAALS